MESQNAIYDARQLGKPRMVILADMVGGEVVEYAARRGKSYILSVVFYRDVV